MSTKGDRTARQDDRLAGGNRGFAGRTLEKCQGPQIEPVRHAVALPSARWRRSRLA